MGFAPPATGQPLRVDDIPMRYDSFRHHRRSIRMKGYDYASAGAYFVTVCTQFRENLFGKIADGVIHMNDNGRIVEMTWDKLLNHFSGIELDESVIMPNHFHGILWIDGTKPNGGARTAPLQESPCVGAGSSRPDLESVRPPHPKPQRVTLGQMVAYFKHQTTKAINVLRGNPNPAIPVWQRNYYERIIRNDNELDRIRQYIRDNPENWDDDQENPIGYGLK